MALKFRKISENSAVKFLFTETLHLLLLKLYLPLVHKIAFANKFQLFYKIKYNIDIFLHIKHPQSISPIFLILFLNSNNESLDFKQQEDYSISENHENE